MTTNGAGASETMQLYFKCMDQADFETALTLFDDDAQYLRAPLPKPGTTGFGEGGTVTIDGKAAIAEFFQLRGKRGTEHRIVQEGVVDNHWWAEGRVSVDGSEDRTFLVHVEFTDDGRMARFLALR